jgi:threonine/homoserine/homoserine lactone efflux protein
MDISFLFKGLIIGFSIAAPVGPIGVLCIRRTLAERRASGLVSGLGAATADAIYGFVAGFGLTFISNFFISQQVWLRLIGGGFLCYLGLRTSLSKPAEHAASVKGNGLVGSYASTFFLTITNHDNPFFCGDICRIGSGRHELELCLCNSISLGRIYRLSPMVVCLERRCQRVSYKV